LVFLVRPARAANVGHAFRLRAPPVLRRPAAALVGLFWLALAAAGPQQARLLRFPAIHSSQVVFAYAGDLYTVRVEGGVARRLTSHEGYEMFPRFSPDGRWIAFTGQYDGHPRCT